MKNIYLSVLLFLFSFFNLFAEKYDFEEISIPGVENPMCITLSPDGLQLIIIDWPKKGYPQMKKSNRPYLESKWGTAIDIEAVNKLIDMNTRIDGPCFSFDGKYIFFAANFTGSLGGMDIYYSVISEETWSEPKNLGAPVNTSENENYPSVSGNNRILFFTREVKMKKLDEFNTGELWMSMISKDEKNWGVPEKLNTQINSGGISFPKIYDDNKTLFYSRVDDDKEKWKIHWAKRMTNIHWYLPVKIDTLASKDSEIAPYFCKQDGYLYYVRLDDGGFHPKGIIYRYPIEKNRHSENTIEISGKIINPLSNEPIKANVLVTDPLLGRIEFFTQSDQLDGSFRALLNAQKTYMFHVWKDDFSHRYQLFTKENTNHSLVADFELFPQVELTLNMYDKEQLWPLDGNIVVEDNEGQTINFLSAKSFKGQQKLTLPLGVDYKLSVSVKDYFDNTIELAFSNIVLFDEFVRDIELIPMKRELEFYVSDEENNNPLMASIEIIDQRENRFTPNPVTGVIGLYAITLREGEFFDLEVRGPRGFAFKHVEIDLNSDRELKRLGIELKPLKRKVPIRLDNINFESNSADLMESSFSELSRVVQLFKDNPDIHVEIMAHTDDVGSDKFNNVLADKRAKSVVEYLVVSGIAGDRLVAKGYGETMPLVANDTEENKAINRRVEMRILDEEDKDFYLEERITE